MFRMVEGKGLKCLAIFLVVAGAWITLHFVDNRRTYETVEEIVKETDYDLTYLIPGVHYKPACENISLTKEACEQLSQKELPQMKKFPVQVVAGAPGSGNNWLLWMASLSGYTWDYQERNDHCEIYGLAAQGKEYQIPTLEKTNCLFLKSHEPWFPGYNEDMKYYHRTVLLLRHPYDAAYANYKRKLARDPGNKSKTSTTGISAKKFINPATNVTNREWKSYIMDHYADTWLEHAKYWLTNYSKPLHPLLYMSIKENTVTEVENMQRFFGYDFSGPNFRRHCCVMADSLNPTLKRKKSPADQYKEYIYDTDMVIHDKVEQAVSKVHQMLDKKYPKETLRIQRG